MILLLPILLPLVAATLCCALSKKSRAACDAAAAFACAVVLAVAVVLGFNVANGAEYSLSFPVFGDMPFSLRFDGYRAVFVAVAAFLWLAATLFGREYFKRGKSTGRYQLFSMLTFSATTGVFMSADLLTTFLFFEWVSLCSFPLVAYDDSLQAKRAARLYLVIAVIGGLAVLMGLMLLHDMTGTLVISELSAATATVSRTRLYTASALMLFGFGAKAGLVPLHIWLPPAHTAAPAPASALLSGVLTKTGVFGVLIITCELLAGDTAWGAALMAVAVASMLLGAVLALFSTNLKRTLAYSTVSQIGFIALGIAVRSLLGQQGALAAQGTLLHMINHSLAKLTLFSVAGVIYMNTHKLELNDIRGWGRKKPLLGAAFLSGALSLAGTPLFGGYVSKTLLHESVVELMHTADSAAMQGCAAFTEYAFLIAGGLTIAYMAKLFTAVFVEKPVGVPVARRTKKAHYMSGLSSVVILTGAAALPILGVFPHRLSERLAAFAGSTGGTSSHAVHYFEWINLRGFVISLVVGVLLYIFAVLLPRRKNGGADYKKRLFKRLNWEKLSVGAKKLVAAVTPAQGENNRTVSRFYEKYYWLFYPEKLDSQEQQTKTGSFSFGLLMLGIGLSAVLAWMLWIYAPR